MTEPEASSRTSFIVESLPSDDGKLWSPTILRHVKRMKKLRPISFTEENSDSSFLIPGLSGPTSGATWLADVKEWYIQVRRWGIGTADNFHYFMFKVPRLPIMATVIFAIGYFLCGASLFNVAAAFFPLLCSDVELWWLPKPFEPFHLLLLFGLILPQLLYGALFLLDAAWCRWTLKIKEDIFIVRNVLHWMLTPISIIGLSLIQLWSYHVLAIQGKKACIHRLAGKATLGQVDSQV